MAPRARAFRRSRKSNFNLGLPGFFPGTQSQNFQPIPAGMLWRYLIFRVLIVGKSDAAGFNMLNPNNDQLGGIEGSSDYDVLMDSLYSAIQLFLSGTTQLIQQMPLSGYRAAVKGTMLRDPLWSLTTPGTVAAANPASPNNSIAIPAVGAAATLFEMDLILPIGLDWAYPALDMFKQSSAAMNTGRFEFTPAATLPITVPLQGGNLVVSGVVNTLAFVGEKPPRALETYAGAAYKLERVSGQQSDSPPVPIARWLALSANNGRGVQGQLTGPLIVDDASASFATIESNSVPTQQVAAMSFRQVVELGLELEAPRLVPVTTRLVPPDLGQLPDEVDQELRSFSIKTNNASSTITMQRLTWLPAPDIAGAVPVASRDALVGGGAPEGVVLVPPGAGAAAARAVVDRRRA